MTEQTISEEIPQINLSDPKQLADFARYLEFSNHFSFI
jgi:transcription factor YY